MAWTFLLAAGLFEVGFTTCLGKAKESGGAGAMVWWTGFVACLFISMALLFKASEKIPLGTAYAVWTGVGAAGTLLVGIFVFKEPAEFWRLFFLGTLILSIVGLKFVSH